MDMKIFVECDPDTRLSRRIRRDLEERGRELDAILSMYKNFVKPSYETYIAPTRRHADIIVPRGNTNRVAIELIVGHIQRKLEAGREAATYSTVKAKWKASTDSLDGEAGPSMSLGM